MLEALLEVADSVMTYRSRYCSRFQLAPVLDLLLTDETNPRSVAFQLVECDVARRTIAARAVTQDDTARRATGRVAAAADAPRRRPRSPAPYEQGDATPLDALLRRRRDAAEALRRDVPPLLVPRRLRPATGGIDEAELRLDCRPA